MTVQFHERFTVLRQSIPTRSGSWQEEEPGWTEVDTVSFWEKQGNFRLWVPPGSNTRWRISIRGRQLVRSSRFDFSPGVIKRSRS
jgi:hypothetical protein